MMPIAISSAHAATGFQYGKPSDAHTATPSAPKAKAETAELTFMPDVREADFEP
jgi:hypothetical protein